MYRCPVCENYTRHVKPDWRLRKLDSDEERVCGLCGWRGFEE